MKSEWRVQCNIVAGERTYIPYRILDVDKIVHSGNIEHYGQYTKNREEAQAIVDELNNQQ